MAIDNVLASVAVQDLKTSIAWYEKVFGRAPDSTPMPEVAEWKFPRGGWLQVYSGAGRAGKGSFTLAVTDLAGHIAKLDALGIDTKERSEGPLVKTLMITDPDGNHIAFAEALSASLARLLEKTHLRLAMRVSSGTRLSRRDRRADGALGEPQAWTTLDPFVTTERVVSRSFAKNRDRRSSEIGTLHRRAYEVRPRRTS